MLDLKFEILNQINNMVKCTAAHVGILFPSKEERDMIEQLKDEGYIFVSFSPELCSICWELKLSALGKAYILYRQHPAQILCLTVLANRIMDTEDPITVVKTVEEYLINNTFIYSSPEEAISIIKFKKWLMAH